MSGFRADRLATLYIFHPLRRLRPWKPRIPILMYHSISESPDVYSAAYFDTCTSPRVFCEHLRLLVGNGYKTIGLGEAARKLEEGIGTSERLVVLTFDDGFADFYTEAFPALSAFGCSATVFLPTDYIGESPLPFKRRPCLTWRQVRELHRAGVEFGSHTATHPQLTTMPAPEVERELQSSKEEIEERVGAPVTSFSYPYAFPEARWAFRRGLRDILVRAGYKNGVSTIIGTAGSASDRLFLERIPVNSSDDETLFTAKLHGGYDWLHVLQLASKLCRSSEAVS